MDDHNGMDNILKKALDPLGIDQSLSRRKFPKLTGVSIAGISALWPLFGRGDTKPLIILEQSKGIVIADPTKSVGCRRCELACTEFNDGKASCSPNGMM